MAGKLFPWGRDAFFFYLKENRGASRRTKSSSYSRTLAQGAAHDALNASG